MNKLGRLPRAFNQNIPHMSSLRMFAKKPAPIPAAVNYAPSNLNNFGMMLNDQLGDCTCAAFYHALQIWSLYVGKNEMTETDKCVLGLYEKACGYNPDDPNTDQGGVEQHVLDYLMKHGAPTDSGVPHKIIARYEVDPRNLDDVRRTIYECGVAYIGFQVPENLMAAGDPPKVWELKPGEPIVGGHAIILTGYDDDHFGLISWGKKYKMTKEFFSAYTDEVYGIVDPAWLNATGRTPVGLSAAQLEQIMVALR